VEEIIGHGGLSPYGQLGFSPRRLIVLELSLVDALQLFHNYIGTEHILIAVVSHPGSSSIRELALDPVAVTASIRTALQSWSG